MSKWIARAGAATLIFLLCGSNAAGRLPSPPATPTPGSGEISTEIVSAWSLIKSGRIRDGFQMLVDMSDSVQRGGVISNLWRTLSRDPVAALELIGDDRSVLGWLLRSELLVRLDRTEHSRMAALAAFNAAGTALPLLVDPTSVSIGTNAGGCPTFSHLDGWLQRQLIETGCETEAAAVAIRTDQDYASRTDRFARQYWIGRSSQLLAEGRKEAAHTALLEVILAQVPDRYKRARHPGTRVMLSVRLKETGRELWVAQLECSSKAASTTCITE